MKRILFFFTFAYTCTIGFSQGTFTLVDDQSTFVYSLPKTELVIEIQTEKITQQPGMFFKYSERYLATNKVIVDEKVTHNLKSIKITTRAVPDSSRTFNYVMNKSNRVHLSINALGILCGVNVPSTIIEPKCTQLPICKDYVCSKASLLPLGEEFLMAGSESKLAEGAAKQIYRIRESRISLLTAEVEKLPADGSSFSVMMEGLDKKERELTELFIGTTKTEILTKQLVISPKSAINNQVLFRLSALRGIVASDDLSGAPYYISIEPSAIISIAADPKEKKVPAGIYTVLPSVTRITVNDGVSQIFSDRFQIPQFGKIVPLDEETLKQANIKVFVDDQTGRLIRIE